MAFHYPTKATINQTAPPFPRPPKKKKGYDSRSRTELGIFYKNNSLIAYFVQTQQPLIRMYTRIVQYSTFRSCIILMQYNTLQYSYSPLARSAKSSPHFPTRKEKSGLKNERELFRGAHELGFLHGKWASYTNAEKGSLIVSSTMLTTRTPCSHVCKYVVSMYEVMLEEINALFQRDGSPLMLCSTSHPNPIQSIPINDISMEFPLPNFAIHVARSRAELPPIGSCVGNIPDQPQSSAVFKSILVIVFLVFVCISVIRDRFFYSVVIVWVKGKKVFMQP